MPKYNSQKTQKLKILDSFFRMFFFFKKWKKYPPINKKEVNEVLVLGMLLIGDTIMYIPVLRTIKKNFPFAKITLICGKTEKTILEEQGLIDEFILVKSPWITYDYSLKNIINFFSTINIINKKYYDLAIDFRGDWRNIFFMNFIHSTRKISYNFTGGEYMLTDVIIPDKNINHFIEESFFLLKQIGCEFTETDKLPVLNLTIDGYNYISTFKTQNNLENRLVIGVHPGASQEVKKWDEKKYGDLIVKLSNAKNTSFFIIYEGPNERETVNQIEHILREKSIDYLVVNKPLKEYISLVSLCQLVICNDSGAAHIASAFSTPTIVIFGNVNPLFVSPYGSKNLSIISHNLECKPCLQSVCKFGTNLCISSITVEEVYNQAINIIKFNENEYK